MTDVDCLEAMYKALIATKRQTAWLVATGTLTNVALLFQKYTDLAEHLKGLSIMGGAIGGKFTDAPMGKVKGEGERFGNWTGKKIPTEVSSIRVTDLVF
jgi:uridine nucleosidase